MFNSFSVAPPSCLCLQSQERMNEFFFHWTDEIFVKTSCFFFLNDFCLHFLLRIHPIDKKNILSLQFSHFFLKLNPPCENNVYCIWFHYFFFFSFENIGIFFLLEINVIFSIRLQKSKNPEKTEKHFPFGGICVCMYCVSKAKIWICIDGISIANSIHRIGWPILSRTPIAVCILVGTPVHCI